MGRMSNIDLAFMNGESSYPDKRIMYPDSPGPIEDAWLAGYNSAKYASEVETGELGIDTFLWHYKTGD